MEKFWWSGEIEADIGDSYRRVMKAIARDLNQLLDGISFGGKAEEWAFIAIILREQDGIDFKEIVKKTSHGKVLEFRLKIPHKEFSSASPTKKAQLIFSALARSVTLMEKLGVPAETRQTLESIVTRAGRQYAA